MGKLFAELDEHNRAYVEEHAVRSIDGLPALRARRLAATGPR